MASLRHRIIGLSALVALFATVVCGLASGWAAARAFASEERQEMERARIAFGERLAGLVRQAAFELDDYAEWDELWQQMPRPEAAWAAINLRQGEKPGALIQAVATFSAGGHLTGRYRRGEARGTAPGEGDPALAWELESLARLGGRSGTAGLALVAGRPAIFAVAPVLRSDRSGPGRGILLGLSYCGPEDRSRLDLPGWELALLTGHESVEQAQVDDHLRLRLPLPSVLGRIEAVLSCTRAPRQAAWARVQLTLLGAGILAAGVAALAGSLLGWRWLRPVAEVADAGEARARGGQGALPDPEALALDEARRLAQALRDLVAAEGRGRQELSLALEREQLALAVNRRFLAQLAHGFADPLRRLVAAIHSLEAGGGRLAHEELLVAKQAAGELEERFQDVLGLAAEHASSTTPAPAPALGLDGYLASVVDLLRPQAQNRGIRLECDAEARILRVDARLTTPVLINLAANALRNARSRVVLSVREEEGSLRWRVEDDGPGLEPDLAVRFRSACREGMLQPGEQAFGLGIALCLANARALGGGLELVRSGSAGTAVDLVHPLGDSSGLRPVLRG